MKQSRVEERQVATQERQEARFDAKMGAPGRVRPGPAPSIPPEPPLGGRFAQVGITVRTRTRAFRHLGSTATESANSFKTMISIIFGPGRDTSLQKSFGPGLLQGCYRDI